MGMFPAEPGVPKRGPRIIKSSADDPAAQPGGGMTLDALMLRQKELAGSKAPMPATMGTPAEGVFYALQKGLEGYQQGRAERDVSTGQQAVGNALASLGPNGELTPEGKAALSQYDPDMFLKLWALQQQKEKVDQWTQIPTPEGENGQWYQNQHGETKKVGGGSPGEGAPKLSDMASLRDDYTKAAAVYENAAPRWQTMKDAAKVSFGTDEGMKGGSDYNLIVGFAKLLDPNSVVREGEVKSAGDLGGYISTVNSWLNKWKTNGGKIDDNIRASIMEESQRLMKGYYDQAKGKRDWISGVATRNRINPDDIVSPLAEFQGWQRDTSDDPPDPEFD